MSTRAKTILLVEDEEGLILTLEDRLGAEGYKIETCRDGISGFERASKPGLDLIILDLMLPGKTGLDICRDLRARSILTPILMLTARGQTVDRVVGLRMGADDYLGKPFDMSELLARIDAVLRRAGAPAAVNVSSASAQNTDTEYRFGEFRVDFRTCRLFKLTADGSDGREIEVPSREFRLLQYFLLHRGEVLSRDQLLDSVWGYESIPSTRTVDVHVAWLRQKIEENPQHPFWIETVRGLGYRFNEQA